VPDTFELAVHRELYEVSLGARYQIIPTQS